MKKTMTFALSLIVLLAFTGCSVMLGLDKNAPAASITGNITSRSFDITETLLGVQASGGVNVSLIQSNETSLDISTDEGYFPRVKQTLENGILYLGTVYAEDRINAKVSFTLRTDLDKLKSLSASGGSTLTTSSLNNDLIELNASGGAQLNLETLRTSRLDMSISGGATINMNHLNTARVNLQASGGATLSITESCSVNSSRLELSGGAKIKGICTF